MFIKWRFADETLLFFQKWVNFHYRSFYTLCTIWVDQWIPYIVEAQTKIFEYFEISMLKSNSKLINQYQLCWLEFYVELYFSYKKLAISNLFVNLYSVCCTPHSRNWKKSFAWILIFSFFSQNIMIIQMILKAFKKLKLEDHSTFAAIVSPNIGLNIDKKLTS